MASLNLHDLNFILQQIRIAEQHAAGTPLSELVDNPLLPYGLRTVDGTFNNLTPGRETWGAADQPFPSMLDPHYGNDQDGDSFDPDGPGPAGGVINTDYAQPGNVADADPRIISNLIVDQTGGNPAAIAAALAYYGSDDPVADAAAITQAYNSAKSAGTDAAREAYYDVLESFGIEHQNGSMIIPNVSPDEGLSAPYNSWFTLFGQFFDHGLDLVAKGGNGTVYVPLQPDDPLYVEGSHTNFMVLTRTSADAGGDGLFGTDDDVRAPNLTTPFIDQNQTYTSHASHQVFLRGYTENAAGKPVATGELMDGASGGLPTWAEIKQQARDLLGINLTDADVGNIPLLLTDQYGQFVRGPNGYPQVVTGVAVVNGKLVPTNTVEGNPDAPVSTQNAVRTGHAFLDDIAHNAAPVFNATGQLAADSDSLTGNDVAMNSRGQNVEYDNELLDRHFITGDGRGNENIGLTAVHHVFHSEHNRQVEEIKATLLASGDNAIIDEWQLPDGSWDGERLFQAARFATEMQYQHLVFEEFARKIQPDIDLFVFNASTDINPAIVSEFADVVYRFGHSMLTETVALMSPTNQAGEQGLISAFLNPVAFSDLGSADQAAGAIVRGMTRQTGNEIDEFVTGALRNNLLGLPLDLATINLTRARENGVPTFNEARAQFFEMTGDTQLKPYESWVDLAQNLKNVASIVNFIAAYGEHDTIRAASTLAGKRAAAEALIFGDDDNVALADRLDFLNSTGAWADRETGLNLVDLWIGGLAEKHMPFGGMLGSTFSFVFELTMENLQNGDRFYYLSRTQGLNFLNELEANTFGELIMRNTDLGSPGQGHVPGDIFSVPNYILEMNKLVQIGNDPQHGNPLQQALSPLVIRKDLDSDGDSDYLQYTGNDHVVLGGTEEDDVLIAGGGDDTIWGDGGNDIIEAGYGVDRVHGGDGDDRITNSGTDIGETDFLHGDAGDDVMHGGSGLALIFGGDGSDFISTGKDGKEAFGGEGNDFILGGEGADFLLGNEGDDWIEAGNGFDTTAGDNSELFFNSTVIGHDVMFAGQNEHDFDAESGDDIMVQGESVMRSNGMAGFDWAIHKGGQVGANSDLGVPIFVNQPDVILRNRFDLVEGLSGWSHNDVLTGREFVIGQADGNGGAAIPAPGTPLASYSNALFQSGVDRIAGFDRLVDHIARNTGNPDAVVMETSDATDILLGGGGSDVMFGKAGNDIIDGDAWLNVRISVRDAAGNEVRTVDSLTEIEAELLAGTIKTKDLHIVREVLFEPSANAIDTARFSDIRANYTVTHNLALDTWTVAHTGGDGSDGVDTLRNIERLQFADLVQTINNAPTGLLAISGSAGIGRTLTASIGSVADADGMQGAALSYQWQVLRGTTFLNIAGATGASFTPGAAQAGAQLRVVATYTDALGTREMAASAPTAQVGMSITGTGLADTLDGTSGDDVISGLAGNDRLNGLAGNDYLDGGLGADTMVGGTGNDTYVVDNSGDTVVEGPGAGTDGVETTLASYTLGANLENLAYIGNANFNGTGNGLDNRIDGGAGSDTLNGGAGNDTLNGGAGADQMVGGAGNDAYVVDNAGDTVVEGANGGADTVSTTLASYTLGTDLENLAYIGIGSAAFTGTGNALDNVITSGAGNDTLNGGDGNDTLDGGAGADRMVGGTGNDTYVVDHDGDVVVEVGTGGAADTVLTSLATYVLANTIENLSYTGTADFSGSGNSAANAITGGIGNDTLDGGAGVDLLVGGDGNDTLLGGSQNDTLQGGDGNDMLNGDLGADTMAGGNGNDTYVVDNANDSVVEASGEGIDLVQTALASYTLSANVENLLYNGTGNFTGTGNTLDNTITGHDGNDTLDGDTGNDTMAGGRGNDTYVVDSALDTIVELAEGGNDTVRTKLNTYTLQAEIENLSFIGPNNFIGTGNALDNNISGGAGNDVLDGGAGADIMTGGTGSDRYIVDHINDVVIEANGAIGIDVVETALDAYMLGSGVEQMVYTGIGNFTGTGSSQANTIVGGNGNDVLDGGLGVDRLEGGQGNDTYYVNVATDVVVESFNAGTDTVFASSNYTLGNNVENLSYAGAAGATLTGNSLANVLTGGAGADTLRGLEGNDRLMGLGGNDVLTGGTGSDIFVFKLGFGNDRITDFDELAQGGQDLLDISGFDGINAGNFASQVTIAGVPNTGNVMVTIGSDSITLVGVNSGQIDMSDFLLA
ncbi:peroxidase family protein [Noviherbaspirillum sp. 1P10PC]|uniref:peroxidase family protein n=1 Tax=Noviherbaspirillum sp. 1P10PC TaxID=3132292 RepID=UPI0039A3CC93